MLTFCPCLSCKIDQVSQERSSLSQGLINITLKFLCNLFWHFVNLLLLVLLLKLFYQKHFIATKQNLT